jgi:hypothetical protein
VAYKIIEEQPWLEFGQIQSSSDKFTTYAGYIFAAFAFILFFYICYKIIKILWIFILKRIAEIGRAFRGE